MATEPQEARAPRARLRRRFVTASAWVTSLDGSLLTDAAWGRRHLLILVLATVNGTVSFVVAASSEHGGVLWVEGVALVACLVFGATYRRSRRPRELAMVVAFLLCAAIQNQYIGNLSALAAAYILLASVYQDWLPIAAALLGAWALPALALFAPEQLESWAAFGKEPATQGAWMRFAGIYLAAAVALLSWRANGVATRDAQTGLATRALAERRVSIALRNGRRPVVFVCDVDAFRLAADNLSRSSTDALIRAVGRRLRSALSPNHVVAVGGGAKYIVVSDDHTDLEQVRSRARTMCLAVSAEPFSVLGSKLPLTITVGAAVAEPGDEASDLIRAADVSMRHAKGRGEPAIALADRELVGLRPPDEPLIAELRQALARDEFVIHYQPIVDVASGSILGAEALVRWQHPTRGLLLPVAFLPVTELHPWLNAGTARDIARAALLQLKQWDTEIVGCLPAGLSVNVAPGRLGDPALRDEICDLLEAAGVEASRLVLELTEGGLMSLDIDVPRVLGELADVGLRIAIDDFGSGHSSLSRLRDLPLHEIKIDRSFTSRVLESPTDQAVIRAVLAIAAEFGAEVVVEGVESDEQRKAIAEMRPDVMCQGFLFARPMPGAELTELLRTGATLPRG